MTFTNAAASRPTRAGSARRRPSRVRRWCSSISSCSSIASASVDRVEADEPHVAARLEAAVAVEHVGDAAAHAGREVAPRRAEDHHAAAGHVLAAVVADALDDGARARVADREALAREAAEERPARGRAVEHGVADDDVLLGHERGVVGRAHGEHAAGEALARVVVGVADQRQLDARRQPGAERLPGRAAQREADRLRRQPLGPVDLRDRAREQPADRAVDVADRELAADRLAVVDRVLGAPRSAASPARPGAASPAGARAAAACPRAPPASPARA